MADKTKDDNNEPKEHEEEFGEEFDFESDPHTDALVTEELDGGEEVQEVVEPAKRRSVMLPLIIGAAVVGFIGWKGYGYLSAPKTTQTKGAPKSTQIEVTKLDKAAPTSPTVAADITQPKGAIPNLYEAEQQAKQAVSDEKITAILQKKIDDQLNAQKQQIEAIQKEVASANQNSANANKATAAVQHDLAMLQTTVQELVNQIKSINANEAAALAKEQAREAKERERAAKPKKPKITNKSESFTSPNLSVHAIIPGRAWIRTPDGKTITVTEGDTVGEYGKVLKIDAANGQVVTTSGVTLR